MRRLMTATMMAMTMVAVGAAQGKMTEQAKAPMADAKTAPSAAGMWNMTIDSPHGTMAFKVDLKLDGKKITGMMSSDMMGEHTLTGEVTDGNITFKLTADGAGEMEFHGKLKDADSLVGTLTSGAGDMACAATRAKGK